MQLLLARRGLKENPLAYHFDTQEFPKVSWVALGTHFERSDLSSVLTPVLWSFSEDH